MENVSHSASVRPVISLSQILNTAIVSYTPNIPQDRIGTYVLAKKFLIPLGLEALPKTWTEVVRQGPFRG